MKTFNRKWSGSRCIIVFRDRIGGVVLSLLFIPLFAFGNNSEKTAWSSIPGQHAEAAFLASAPGETSHAHEKRSWQIYTAGQDTVRAEVDGSLHLTAENGCGIGPEIDYMPEWKAFGWFRSDDRVEWTVQVAEGGVYEIHLEWSVSDEQAGKPFLFQIGNTLLKGTVTRTGSWETFKTKQIGKLYIPAGTHTMVFKPATDFDDDDALLDLRHINLVPFK